MSTFNTEVIKGVAYIHIGQLEDWEVYIEKDFYEHNHNTCHRLLEYLKERGQHSVYEQYLVRDEVLYYPKNTLLSSGHKYRIKWKMTNISILIDRL